MSHGVPAPWNFTSPESGRIRPAEALFAYLKASSNHAGAILGGLALSPPAQQTLLPILPTMSREPLMDDIMNRPRTFQPLKPSKVKALYLLLMLEIDLASRSHS